MLGALLFLHPVDPQDTVAVPSFRLDLLHSSRSPHPTLVPKVKDQTAVSHCLHRVFLRAVVPEAETGSGCISSVRTC